MNTPSTIGVLAFISGFVANVLIITEFANDPVAYKQQFIVMVVGYGLGIAYSKMGSNIEMLEELKRW